MSFQNKLSKGLNFSSDHFYLELRHKMVHLLRKQGIKDKAVLNVMEQIPREFFVDPSSASKSYSDQALPLIAGQTISQPYIVAYMTELLGLKPTSKVLEIGTGSGYQTAVLALLSEQVFSVERIPELADFAKAKLAFLGINNVEVKCDDGTLGWKEHAPYDAILIAAAGPIVPQPLMDQLAINGCLVMPLEEMGQQNLVRVYRMVDGFKKEQLNGVRFVPLVGYYGYTDKKNQE